MFLLTLRYANITLFIPSVKNTESEIAALAMLAAAKIMGGENASDDSGLYDQFIKKAGDVNDAGSH